MLFRSWYAILLAFGGFPVTIGEEAGFGEGEDVVVEPGLPFLTLITKWLSSSALTSMQVSPSHSSAIAPIGNISAAMRVRESNRRIAPS